MPEKPCTRQNRINHRTNVTNTGLGEQAGEAR